MVSLDMFSGIKVKGKEEEADGSVSFLFFPRLVRNGAGFTGGCWGCSFPAGVAGEDIIVSGSCSGAGRAVLRLLPAACGLNRGAMGSWFASRIWPLLFVSGHP
jgi:hypothetical protein